MSRGGSIKNEVRYHSYLSHESFLAIDVHFAQDCFTSLCTVKADTSLVATTVYATPKGLLFRQSYDIVLLCGQTEMKAHISWIEDVSHIFMVLEHDPDWSSKPQGEEKRYVHTGSLECKLTLMWLWLWQRTCRNHLRRR